VITELRDYHRGAGRVTRAESLEDVDAFQVGKLRVEDEETRFE